MSSPPIRGLPDDLYPAPGVRGGGSGRSDQGEVRERHGLAHRVVVGARSRSRTDGVNDAMNLQGKPCV